MLDRLPSAARRPHGRLDTANSTTSEHRPARDPLRLNNLPRDRLPVDVPAALPSIARRQCLAGDVAARAVHESASTIVLALALLLALAAVFFARSWMLGQARIYDGGCAGGQDCGRGRVAEFGDRLTKENLRLIDWPAGSVPDGTFQRSTTAWAAAARRAAGYPAQRARFRLQGHGPGAARLALAVITSGMRAMTIRVNDVLGVAGFVLPGDRVDVMLTREIVKDQPITDVLLQNVKILGIDQRSDQDDNTPDVCQGGHHRGHAGTGPEDHAGGNGRHPVSRAARRQQCGAGAGKAGFAQGSRDLRGNRHCGAEARRKETGNAGREDRAEGEREFCQASGSRAERRVRNTRSSRKAPWCSRTRSLSRR